MTFWKKLQALGTISIIYSKHQSDTKFVNFAKIFKNRKRETTEGHFGIGSNLETL